jgi:hypothetical protein
LCADTTTGPAPGLTERPRAPDNLLADPKARTT